MRKLVLILVSALASLAFIAGPASAASASTTAPVPAAVTAASGGTVTVEDESWSAPAKSVTCTSSTTYERVTCEPEDTKSVVEESCYSKVPLANGFISTVCTTYEGNRSEIKNVAGGGELKLEYGCQFGDALCVAMESMSRGISTLITGGLAWAVGSATFSTESYLWEVAVGEWAWWQATVIGIVLIAAVIALTMAAWSRDKEELAKTLVRTFFALPLSAASVWLVGQLANSVDTLTQEVITRDGGTSLYSTVENMIFSPATGNYFLSNLVLLCFVAATIILVFVFSFRNLALASLIALGPVAWMLFPATFGGQWVVRWISAVAALLLVSPLTLGMMMLVLRGFGEVETLWSIQALPLGIGLCMLVFAPLAVFGLFSFAVGALQGNAAENAASNLGQRAGQGAQRIGRSVSNTAQRASQARQTMNQSRQAMNKPTSGKPTAQTRTSQPRPASRPSSPGGPNRQQSPPPQPSTTPRTTPPAPATTKDS